MRNRNKNTRLFPADIGRQRIDRIVHKILVEQRNNLVFLHPNNESSGLIAQDISPNGLQADIINATINSVDAPGGIRGMTFDGIDDGIDGNGRAAALQAAWTNRNEFTFISAQRVETLGVWTDGAIRIIAEMWADNDNSYEISKRGNGKIRFDAVLNGQTYRYELQDLLTVDWFITGYMLFAAGGGNKTISVYLGGALVGSDTQVTQNWITAPDRYTLFAQRNLASRFWKGSGGFACLINGAIGSDKMIEYTGAAA